MPPKVRKTVRLLGQSDENKKERGSLQFTLEVTRFSDKQTQKHGAYTSKIAKYNLIHSEK